MYGSIKQSLLGIGVNSLWAANTGGGGQLLNLGQHSSSSYIAWYSEIVWPKYSLDNGTVIWYLQNVYNLPVAGRNHRVDSNNNTE